MGIFLEAFWMRFDVSQRYLEVWDVLFGVCSRNLRRFSWVLSCSERHLNIQKCHLMLQSKLRQFCRFRKVHLRFFGVLWCSGMFWRIFKHSHWVWVVLKDSCTFWSILWSSRGFLGILMGFKQFWHVPVCYQTFADVLVYSTVVLKVLRHSLTFRDVLSRYAAFSCVKSVSDVLGYSGTFRGVLMSFERLLSHSDTFSWN